jgi:hypothetical protein
MVAPDIVVVPLEPIIRVVSQDSCARIAEIDDVVVDALDYRTVAKADWNVAQRVCLGPSQVGTRKYG